MMQDKSFLKLAFCVFMFSLLLNAGPSFAQTVVLNGKTVVENGQPVAESVSDSSAKENEDSSHDEQCVPDTVTVTDTVKITEKLSVDSTLKAYGISRNETPWTYAFWTNLLLALSQKFFQILMVQFMFCAIAFMANRIAKKTNNTEAQLVIVLLLLLVSILNVVIQG